MWAGIVQTSVDDKKNILSNVLLLAVAVVVVVVAVAVVVVVVVAVVVVVVDFVIGASSS